MSHGHYQGIALPTYILTDASGFVTSCEASLPALRLAAEPLTPPVRVDHWTPTDTGTRMARWVRGKSFSWP